VVCAIKERKAIGIKTSATGTQVVGLQANDNADNNFVRVWKVENQQYLGTLDGHSDSPRYKLPFDSIYFSEGCGD